MTAPNLLSLTTITGNANVITPTTTNQSLVTCPLNGVCKINSIYLSGNGDSANTFTVTYHNDIYAQIEVSGNVVTELIINQPLYLTEGLVLFVKSSSAALNATCTVAYEVLG
tara:strand:+ start:5083 stop:5418 length:336 start_codon:yes stop_codon:yes gene_type:complete